MKSDVRRERLSWGRPVQKPLWYTRRVGDGKGQWIQRHATVLEAESADLADNEKQQLVCGTGQHNIIKRWRQED